MPLVHASLEHSCLKRRRQCEYAPVTVPYEDSHWSAVVSDGPTQSDDSDRKPVWGNARNGDVSILAVATSQRPKELEGGRRIGHDIGRFHQDDHDHIVAGMGVRISAVMAV